jgi:gas vesicle protein
MGTNGSTGSFFKGFVIGGAIGAVTALLLAPQSGEETRTQIQEKGIELREKAEATYADVQKSIETQAADLRSKLEELTAKVDESIAQVRGGLSQKAAKLAEEVAPEKESTSEKPVVSEAVAAS